MLGPQSPRIPNESRARRAGATRRQFLRGAGGFSLGLPLLPSLLPSLLDAHAARAAAAAPKRRFVQMCTQHGAIWGTSMYPDAATLTDSMTYAGRTVKRGKLAPQTTASTAQLSPVLRGPSTMLTPALAVLAARALSALVDLEPRRRLTIGAGVVATIAVVTSLTVPSLRSIFAPSSSGLAGAGGSPGGREAGLWVDAHVPQGARLMTLGPSMSNILEYYSGRRADGLSVSANPLHRNPSYQPIPNPDAALRSGDYQYVVWDASSAKRSPTFAAHEMALIRRYHGQIVHTETAKFDSKAKQPVVVIYEVQP